MDDHIVMMYLGHLLEKYKIPNTSCLKRCLLTPSSDEEWGYISDIGMREDKIRNN
jgi:hypothetical protein